MSQARMCGMHPRVCSKLGAQSVTFLHVRYAREPTLYDT